MYTATRMLQAISKAEAMSKVATAEDGIFSGDENAPNIRES
jgi:hypothetical protein